MKIAIVGSRGYANLDIVRDFVGNLCYPSPEAHIVVTGGAEGVDLAAERAARHHGIGVLVFCVNKVNLPPYPEGKAEFRERAYARNLRIAQECDRMVAFWDGKSGGTQNAIDCARVLGKPVEVIR